MLIDLGLLATLLALAPALAAWRTHGGNGGHDLIVFVAYLPVIMPSALALPSFETLGVEVTLQRVLGRDYGELTATWLIMSLVAILQSVAVAATIWLLQSFWRRKSANGI